MNSEFVYEFNIAIAHNMLSLVDSIEMNDRIFALDILGQLLSNIYDINSSITPSTLKDVKTSVVFAILTRCDDISPAVRSKALTVLSQIMKYILFFFMETKNQGTFEWEHSENVGDINLIMNGNHRFFWYNMRSFMERWIEFLAIMFRRIDDGNVAVRKTALLAFENLLVFQPTCIMKENLKRLERASTDTSVAVRKQLIQSMTVILKFHPENSLVQEYWLKCILPLIQDSDSSVQTKALSVLEVCFLRKISSIRTRKIHALMMLKKLSSCDFLIYHRFFKKAFHLWESADKLKSEKLAILANYVGTEWEGCIWFYISCFACCCSVPYLYISLSVHRLEKFYTTEDYPPFTEHILKVVEREFQRLDLELLNILHRVIYDSLKLLSVPVELIPMYVEILFKLHKCKGTLSEFEIFSSIVIQKCQGFLSDFNANVLELPSEEIVSKCFCAIKELCQMCPSNITPSLISSLLMFTDFTQNPVPISISTSLKAHAYTAIGQISLQNEALARELLSRLTKEMLSSEEDVIRSNIAIILIDLCKRYPPFANKCIPLVSLCFKDKYYLIRYQTIVLLVNLLQEGYIKWQGPLFFAFLSTLVDRSKDIQEMGQYTLCNLLPDKKNMFSEHFIECIFVFNNFFLPDKEVASESVKQLERFSIPGENNRENRMTIYRFLLDFMDHKERNTLIKPICEILRSVAESVYWPDKIAECIVRDCFAILTYTDNGDVSSQQSEDVDETEKSEINKTDLDNRRAAIVGFVLPAIIRLKNCITNPGSDLMIDIILFLKDFLDDFKDSLKDILTEDATLLRQLELEMKKDDERDRRKAKAKKDLQVKDSQTAIINNESEGHSGVTFQEENQTKTNERNRNLEQGSSTKQHKRKSELVACFDQELQKELRYNLRPLPSRISRNKRKF